MLAGQQTLINQKNWLLTNPGLKPSRHQQDMSNCCQSIYKFLFPFTKQNVYAAYRMAFFSIHVAGNKIYCFGLSAQYLFFYIHTESLA